MCQRYFLQENLTAKKRPGAPKHTGIFAAPGHPKPVVPDGQPPNRNNPNCPTSLSLKNRKRPVTRGRKPWPKLSAKRTPAMLTVIGAAARHGQTSAIYQPVKSAADKQG